MRVRVLGPVAVAGGGRSPPPKERALLTVLALNRGVTISAESLVDSLWAEDPPRTAIHTLQGYVSRLRERLGGPAIGGHDGGYRLDLPPEEVDAACFERLADEGRVALDAGDALKAAARLSESLSLWRADPVSGLAPGSPGAADLARLMGLHRAVEERWAEAVLVLGRHGEHVQDLERMAAAEPFREIRWELLMVALHRSGRGADALRAFTRAREGMIEELGIEPGPALRSLEQAILLEDPAVDDRFAVRAHGRDSVGMGLPPMLVDTSPFPFVERELELDTLRRAWKDATDGFRVVLVRGEPGVGKSRLAGEIAREIHREGATVLAGRSDRGLGVPYQPFAEVLSRFATHAGDVEPDMLGELSGELTRLVPRLGRLVPGLPEPYAADADTQQYRLFDAVASWLATLSFHVPVCLVLEDLHWARRPTLLLLRHLARSPEALHVLVIGTARHTELEPDDPRAILLSEIEQESGVDAFTLNGLDEDGVLAFVEAAAARHVEEEGRAFARAVYSRTEGNPLFVGEVLRALVDGGAIDPSAHQWIDGAGLTEMAIPSGVRDTVRGRVARLSSDVRRMLSIAATAGAEFDLAVIEQAADMESAAAVDALDEAVAAGILTEVEGVSPRFGFAHALVQAAIYDEGSIARKAYLHRRVAEAIELVHAAALEDQIADLAHHHAEAASGGDTTRAVECAAQAGRQALAQLAFDDAAGWLARALELYDRGRQPRDDALRCDLLIALGEAQLRAGDAAYRRTLLDAAALAREIRDTDRLAGAALANYRGWASQTGQLDEEKIDVLEAALDAVGPADSFRRARLLTILSGELQYGQETHRARDLADEAVAMARRVGDPTALIDALATRWIAYPSPFEHDARNAATLEMLRLAPQVSDPQLCHGGHWARLWVAAAEGDLEACDRILDDCDRIVSEARHITGLAIDGWGRAALALLRGDLEEAEHHLEEARRLSRAAGNPDAELLVGPASLLLSAERDQFRIMAAGLAETLKDLPDFLVLRASLAWALAEAGDREEARRELEAVVPHLAETIANPAIASAATVSRAALAAAAVGDRAAAEQLYDFMQPWDGFLIGFPGMAYDGPAARILGQLATVLGRHDDAERHFTDSEAMCERMGAVSFLAHNDVDFARLLMRRDHPGDRDRARTLLQRGLTVACERGYATVERHASDVLAEVGGR